jgi:hypothetical protein
MLGANGMAVNEAGMAAGICSDLGHTVVPSSFRS